MMRWTMVAVSSCLLCLGCASGGTKRIADDDILVQIRVGVAELDRLATA